MVKFSQPEERAVKAVLIHKNHRIALHMLQAFILLIIGVGVYSIITIPKNSIKNAAQLFSDNIFTGLIVLCAFALFLVVYFINVPVTVRRVKENGGYKVSFEKDCVKVLFPDEPEIIVKLSDIDAVEEYDIFYLIHCYKRTDEIVCSKNAFEEGDGKAFVEYFRERGLQVQDRNDKKIYVSLLRKINAKTYDGWTSIIYSGIALVLAFPLFWFAIKVLLGFVPNLLTLIMRTLYDLELVVKILLGIIFLPVALVATVIAGVTALGIILMPPSLTYLAGYKAGKQLSMKTKTLGIIATVVCVLVALAILFFLFVVLGVIRI